MGSPFFLPLLDLLLGLSLSILVTLFFPATFFLHHPLRRAVDNVQSLNTSFLGARFRFSVPTVVQHLSFHQRGRVSSCTFRNRSRAVLCGKSLFRILLASSRLLLGVYLFEDAFVSTKGFVFYWVNQRSIRVQIDF